MLGGRFDQHPIVGPGTIVNEARTFRRRSTSRRRSRSTTSSISPRISRATRSRCCCASTCRTCPANPSLHLNGDYPLAWAKTYGKGRVFYGSFAHAAETWDHSRRAADVFRGDALGARAHRRHAEPASDAAAGRCAEVDAPLSLRTRWALMAGCARRTPTFNHDAVAPVALRAQCQPCHRPGQPVPFTLMTYADAKRRARQRLAEAVEERHMPAVAAGARRPGVRRRARAERDGHLDHPALGRGRRAGRRPCQRVRSRESLARGLGAPDSPISS